MLTILAIVVHYLFFQNKERITVDLSSQEPSETLQPTIIPETGINLLQERKNGYSFQPGQQNSFEKKLENKEGREKHINGAPKIAALLVSHQPDQTSKEGKPYEPIDVSSRVENLSDSEDYQTYNENNLKVIEATACSEILNRIPQGSGDSFEWSMDRIYVWSRIKCERPPSSIRHIYYFKGEKVNDISLKIRSPNWRTWSYKTLLSKRYIGPWRVDITSVDGKLLQTIEFEIR
jgi:hypothetical protein